jgi:aminoglycoside/choline kinase family phosphotransferase
MTTLEERHSAWLSDWLSKQGRGRDFQVLPLAGDGSPRPFYRIEATGQTYVLLVEPEWRLSKDYPVHQGYLEREGVPVPAFLAVDPGLGVLLMEDMGDELLQMRLLSNPDERLAWLEEATRLVARLHGSTFPVPANLPASTRSFDANKYFEELSFTIEHLHKGFLKLPDLDPGITKLTRIFCERLEEIRPLVFCHRDYHTRNLLVHQERLRLIDFQDARLGPPEYDLASLFFDAYVPIAESDRVKLLSHYKRILASFPLSKKIDWEGMPERLERVAFQRIVKAAGSFASFYTRHGKKTHLAYLVPALEMARTLQKKLDTKVPPLPLDLWIEKAKEATK